MTKLTAEWVAKAEEDIDAARQLLQGKPLHPDQICFLCQQAIEKYLKAVLSELGMPIDRTHDITILLDQLIAGGESLRSLRRGTKTITRFAVEFRYPPAHTTVRQAKAAYKKARLFRGRIRKRLGLPVR